MHTIKKTFVYLLLAIATPAWAYEIDKNNDGKIDDERLPGNIVRQSGLDALNTAIQSALAGKVAGQITIYKQNEAPGTCAEGDLWIDTDAVSEQRLSSCVSSAWVQQGGGSAIDLSAPPPIGSTTPNTGRFTALQSDSLSIVPPNGETGEMAVHEDPASSGDDWVGFKAPVNVAPGGLDGDLLWVLPPSDGTANQVMATDGAGTLSWITPLRSADIGISVQGYNANLLDLADGSLSGGKVGTGISATNITTGTLPTSVLPSTIPKWGNVPATATATCIAGAAAYDTSYIYICVATNTWVRSSLATW